MHFLFVSNTTAVGLTGREVDTNFASCVWAEPERLAGKSTANNRKNTTYIVLSYTVMHSAICVALLFLSVLLILATLLRDYE